MHYYPFHIADYRKDAGHLTLEEHGIYRQLLDDYYLSEKPVCLDKRKIMRKLRMTPDQAWALDAVLGDFFVESEKGYIHLRVEAELERWYAKSAQARANVMKRYERNANVPEKDTPVVRPYNEGTTDGVLPKTQDPIPKTQSSTTTSKPAVSTEGNGQVPMQAIVEKWNAFAVKNSLPQVIKLTTTIKGQIRQRWNDIPTLEKWDNFFSAIEANDFLAGRCPAGVGRSKPFRSTLLWVTKETNFGKIAAGEYD
jgi:uncharacterized protein YdaU (DUF1376 family)